MAIGDIFRAEFFVENPSGASSFGWYYREIADATGQPAQIQLAGRLETVVSPKILRLIAADFEHTSVRVRQVHTDSSYPYEEDVTPQGTGLAEEPALPSNNAMLFRFQQSDFPQRQNGRIFVPGVSEPNTTVGQMNTDFLQDQMLDFATTAILDVANGATGTWEPGIISQKVLNEVPPAKNWEDAFARLTQIQPWPIVVTQRRRTTRVRGRSYVPV